MSKSVAVKQEHMPQQSEGTAVLSMIERLASDPNADIAKLEKMLDMQERVMKRNAEVAFNAAMAAMQSDIPTVIKRGTGNNAKYAKLEDIVTAVRPTLQKHGFAVSFRIKNLERAIEVTGVLMHREGHREETSMVLPLDTSGNKNAVQAVGSSTSYGKRYVVCALLNIAAEDEDDDGNATKSHQYERVTEEQAANIETLINDAGASLDRFCKFYGKIASVADLAAEDYEGAVAALELKIKQAQS